MKLYWVHDPELMDDVTNEKGVDKAQCYYHALDVEKLEAEVERLTNCMHEAGLAPFMRDGTPEQIAKHLRTVAQSNIQEIARLTAELTALRNRYEKEGK